jgi:biopolymer transport protein TolR
MLVAKRGIGRSSVSADINVTPMADIMLVLLIIFMLTVPSMQNGITVTLPKAINPLDAPGVNKPENFVVALNREGMIYVGKKPVEEKELYDQLRNKFQGGELNKSIFLKADTAVPYGRVVQIVNGCRGAGVDRIGLMAEKVEKD